MYQFKVEFYEKENVEEPAKDFLKREGKQNMSSFNEFLNKQLDDPEFKKEWENIQPEMDVIRAIIEARISQNMTQKELAERTGIDQADISKLENGTRNPSLKLLKRLADGMDMNLSLVFTPKNVIKG